MIDCIFYFLLWLFAVVVGFVIYDRRRALFYKEYTERKGREKYGD